MKRKSRLYNNILSYNSVYNAYKVIKSNCKNKSKVNNYFLFLNSNSFDILKELYRCDYKFGHYNIFLINEKKYRIIMSQSMKDKVINHMVYHDILMPCLDKCLIDTNVATRVNKGSSYAFNSMTKYINSLVYTNKEIYALKIDISKYFYNIDHLLLFNKLKKYIKDKKTLYILKEIISTTDNDYVNNRISYLKDSEIIKVRKMCISNKEKESKIKQIQSLPLYNKGKGLSIGAVTSQLL